MKQLIVMLPLILLCLFGAAAGPPNDPPAVAFEPTDAYEAHNVDGWRVMLNKRFAADAPAQCDELMTLLRVQLYQVTRVVPPAAVQKLKEVTIWVERDEPHHPCMAYHPDAGWLSE